MSPTRSSRQPLEVRREQVLDAALDILLAEGFPSLNMEALARAIGASKPVVYRAFADVEAVVAALIDRESSRLLTRMAEVAEEARRHPGSREPVIVWFHGMAAMVISEPRMWRVMLLHEAGVPDYLREQVRRGRERLREHLTYAVRPEEHGRTWFGSDDPDLAVHAILTLCEHFVRLMLSQPDEYPPERIVSFGLAAIDRIAVA